MIQMRLLRLISFLFFLLATMYACNEKTDKVSDFVQPVKVFKVDQKALNQPVKVFIGLVKESREVNLAFQVPGPIVHLNADEGEYVKKGQLIAAIDRRDYEIQLESANANYENAKQQAERYAALYKKKSTSKSIYDQMQAQFKLAKAQKEAAENALKDTRIYAPFSGYVQKKYVENYEKTGAGHPIISLLDLSDLELTVALSENDFLESDQFESYECKFEAISSQKFPLKLIEIEKKPGMDNFYKMRLRLDAKNKRIVPGMVASVEVRMNQTTDQLYDLPVESVFGENGKSYVWKYNSRTNCVERKTISLEKFTSNGTVMVSGGLEPEDIIVSAGVHSLKEGQKVKPLNASSKTNIGGQL